MVMLGRTFSPSDSPPSPVWISVTDQVEISLISGLLTSAGTTFREALISKEPTKIVEKLSVNSRCNRIYKKRNYNPEKVNIDTAGYCLANKEKIRNKNSERFARNPVLLARPQTFGLHQILRHVSSSEFFWLVNWLQR